MDRTTTIFVVVAVAVVLFLAIRNFVRRRSRRVQNFRADANHYNQTDGLGLIVPVAIVSSQFGHNNPAQSADSPASNEAGASSDSVSSSSDSGSSGGDSGGGGGGGD